MSGYPELVGDMTNPGGYLGIAASILGGINKVNGTSIEKYREDIIEKLRSVYGDQAEEVFNKIKYLTE